MHHRATDDRLPRLVLFPGLAADGRMFEPQRRAFPHLEAPDWLPPLPGERIEAYAQRMAALIPPDPRPLFLGGVSFGAVIALEAARHLPARGVFLIGGGFSYSMIAWPFRWMCHVAPHVPLPLVPLLLKFFPLGLDLIEDLTDEHKQLYVEMSRATPPAMIRWGAHAMTRWSFRGPAPAPTYTIHGRQDEIVPPTGKYPIDRLIPGGRHLISLSHPQQVNAFLAEKMAAAAPARAARM